MKLSFVKNKKLKLKIKLKLIFIFLYIIIIYLFNDIQNQKILLYPNLIIDDFKNCFDLLNNNQTFDLFRAKTKIENIFILIAIFPFIQNEIFITKKHYIFGFLEYIFETKNNDVLKFSKRNITNFSSKFKELLYYEWEYLPNKNNTNYIRHILYHYYSSDCLNIFENSLNRNIGYFIINNNDILSYDLIIDLISNK